MESDFRIKKIYAIKMVVTTGTNLFQHCMDAKKFKTEQNRADITSDSDHDEDELEIL